MTILLFSSTLEYWYFKTQGSDSKAMIKYVELNTFICM